MKTKSRFGRKLQFAFGSAVLALCAVGALSYRTLVESTESDVWVRHTHDVLEKLQDSLAAMQTVESNARGYLLTNDESFLIEYRSGIADEEKDQSIIRALTADNDAQQRRLDTLSTLSNNKFQLAEKVLALRRSEGLEAATAAIQEGSGKRIMDDFQTVLDQMRSEEMRLLILRESDAKHRLAETKTILLLGTILGLLITSVAGWSVNRDNSARVTAEDALHEGEDRFRTLANNIPQLAWMADETGYIFWYNDRWFDYTGTTLAEMAGWGWQKVHDPNHVKRVVEKITRCFQTGEVWDDTFPLRGRDGKYRLFLSRAVPIRDSHGKILRWFGTNTDVSESTDSGAKYRGLLEAAPDAMVVVNQSGEIVLLNVQAEKQFGYSRDELLGQQVTNIIPEGFAERMIADGTRSAAEALAQQIGTGIELIGPPKRQNRIPD